MTRIPPRCSDLCLKNAKGGCFGAASDGLGARQRLDAEPADHITKQGNRARCSAVREHELINFRVRSRCTQVLAHELVEGRPQWLLTAPGQPDPSLGLDPPCAAIARLDLDVVNLSRALEADPNGPRRTGR